VELLRRGRKSGRQSADVHRRVLSAQGTVDPIGANPKPLSLVAVTEAGFVHAGYTRAGPSDAPGCTMIGRFDSIGDFGCGGGAGFPAVFDFAEFPYREGDHPQRRRVQHPLRPTNPARRATSRTTSKIRSGRSDRAGRARVSTNTVCTNPG